MASIFYLPKVVSLPGAKLTFSLTNTATPQDVYTDADLQVAHTQPVQADAAGVFAPIYLDPTLPDYRVKLTTSADVLIYQVDDIPSNQNVQQSMRLESTNPFLFLYDTDGTANLRKYRIRANGNVLEIVGLNDAENSETVLFTTANTATIANQYTGNFTGTLTGMTASTTGQVLYLKIGRVVYLYIRTGFTGTSNTTAMTMTGLPSEVQPANLKDAPCLVKDNGNNDCGAIAKIFGDTITFYIAKSNAVANYVQNLSTGFTNSGAKGLLSGWAISYWLD